MSTVVHEPEQLPVPPPEPEPVNYLNVAHGLLSWLLTKDHKRIALLYLVSITLMFFIGGVAATMMRIAATWRTPLTFLAACTP